MGMKIGITGTTTPSPNIIHRDLTNKTTTLPEIQDLEETVAHLTSLGVDMIVVITHDIVEDKGTLYVGGGGSSKSVVMVTFQITFSGIKPLTDESFSIDVRSLHIQLTLE